MQKEAVEPSGHRGAGHCPDQASHGWGLRERGGDTVRENSRERCGLSPRRGLKQAPASLLARALVRADRGEESDHKHRGARNERCHQGVAAAESAARGDARVEQEQRKRQGGQRG